MSVWHNIRVHDFKLPVIGTILLKAVEIPIQHLTDRPGTGDPRRAMDDDWTVIFVADEINDFTSLFRGHGIGETSIHIVKIKDKQILRIQKFLRKGWLFRRETDAVYGNDPVVMEQFSFLLCKSQGLIPLFLLFFFNFP